MAEQLADNLQVVRDLGASVLKKAVGIGVVGCGYVSDFYLSSLRDYPELTLIGVHDVQADRAAAVGALHRVQVYEDLHELLADDRVKIVVNLTNPDSHADVTLAALAGGKHVYSEKPLATGMSAGRSIVAEAERTGLLVACAPANILGEAFQTLWRELRCGRVRTPRLAYAQLDDGAVHMMGYQNWHNSTGSFWPFRDEFAQGCNIEHSSYHLAALTTMFGPVRRVVADHATLMPDKLPAGEEGPVGADYVTASLTFGSGLVSRLTCSIVAPPDRSLTVVGDGGVLRLDDCWDLGSKVTARRAVAGSYAYLDDANDVPPVRPFSYSKRYSAGHRMDFPRGIADLASAVRMNRTPRLSARQALHVLEVTLAMSSPGGATVVTSEFESPEPMPWAV